MINTFSAYLIERSQLLLADTNGAVFLEIQSYETMPMTAVNLVSASNQYGMNLISYIENSGFVDIEVNPDIYIKDKLKYIRLNQAKLERVFAKILNSDKVKKFVAYLSAIEIQGNDCENKCLD